MYKYSKAKNNREKNKAREIPLIARRPPSPLVSIPYSQPQGIENDTSNKTPSLISANSHPLECPEAGAQIDWTPIKKASHLQPQTLKESDSHSSKAILSSSDEEHRSLHSVQNESSDEEQSRIEFEASKRLVRDFSGATAVNPPRETEDETFEDFIVIGTEQASSVKYADSRYSKFPKAKSLFPSFVTDMLSALEEEPSVADSELISKLKFEIPLKGNKEYERYLSAIHSVCASPTLLCQHCKIKDIKRAKKALKRAKVLIQSCMMELLPEVKKRNTGRWSDSHLRALFDNTRTFAYSDEGEELSSLGQCLIEGLIHILFRNLEQYEQNRLSYSRPLGYYDVMMDDYYACLKTYRIDSEHKEYVWILLQNGLYETNPPDIILKSVSERPGTDFFYKIYCNIYAQSKELWSQCREWKDCKRSTRFIVDQKVYERQLRKLKKIMLDQHGQIFTDQVLMGILMASF
ncbi:hypothetical protein [Aureibacter tunicatorum]|uniref:Uncharacterized protein n=1 Tax=Aureibacter tunicatorum TaxID=866807 RepID=A0AAE3XQP7_9BACT|nr:hypothetical protein [Aureibacter tunicatorum]MDR6240308.1 hypothetical protein [Aureibacter tunicatorum]BDD05811.1 hypothetical protein AUTU_32940 [Aureibacter tunicatorum]